MVGGRARGAGCSGGCVGSGRRLAGRTANGPPHAALCAAGAVLDAELPDAGSEGGDEPREEIGEDEAAEILEAMLGMAPPPAAEPPQPAERPPKKQRRGKVSWGFGRKEESRHAGSCWALECRRARKPPQIAYQTRTGQYPNPARLDLTLTAPRRRAMLRSPPLPPPPLGARRASVAAAPRSRCPTKSSPSCARSARAATTSSRSCSATAATRAGTCSASRPPWTGCLRAAGCAPPAAQQVRGVVRGPAQGVGKPAGRGRRLR